MLVLELHTNQIPHLCFSVVMLSQEKLWMVATASLDPSAICLPKKTTPPPPIAEQIANGVHLEPAEPELLHRNANPPAIVIRKPVPQDHLVLKDLLALAAPRDQKAPWDHRVITD